MLENIYLKQEQAFALWLSEALELQKSEKIYLKNSENSFILIVKITVIL
jgi:hypothetical protein